jgi:hypothetical protein
MIDISKEKYKELLKIYKNQTNLANYFKCSRYQIIKLNKKFNIDKIDIDELKYLFEIKNYNIQELMDHFNISRRIITNKINKYKLVNSIKEKITELYKQEKTPQEIGIILEKSEQEVTRLFKKYSVWREKPIIENIKKKEFTREYIQNNKTLEEMATMYNTSSRTISTFISKNNLHKDTIKFMFNYEELYDLYINKKLTMDLIAKHYNCSRKTINNAINNVNIKERPRNSGLEIVISNFLVDNNIEYIQNSYKIIAPYQLDFYLPTYNIAIETDGLYYHSTKMNKDKYNIYNKRLLCEKKNIRLINIFEDEIVNKETIVKNRLLNILSLNKTKYGARNTSIKEVTNREGIDFLNKYHIQGSGKNTIYLGAFYENQLVSVMSFSKPNIAKGAAKVDWELNRFAVKENIPGMASKFFKYFVNNYKASTIISYADKRWNTGNLYLKLGFKQLKDTNLNYWYTKGKQERKHRFNYTKQKLLDIIPAADSKLTEEQLAKSIGLYRIYDCGSYKFIWDREEKK